MINTNSSLFDTKCKEAALLNKCGTFIGDAREEICSVCHCLCHDCCIEASSVTLCTICHNYLPGMSNLPHKAEEDQFCCKMMDIFGCPTPNTAFFFHRHCKMCGGHMHAADSCSHLMVQGGGIGTVKCGTKHVLGWQHVHQCSNCHFADVKGHLLDKKTHQALLDAAGHEESEEDVESDDDDGGDSDDHEAEIAAIEAGTRKTEAPG